MKINFVWNPVVEQNFLNSVQKCDRSWCIRCSQCVCVCEKHENVKWMVDVISTNVEKTLLIDKLVCDISNGECMLSRSPNFRGKEMLLDHVMRMVDGLEDEIKFKQWESTDRNILLEKKLNKVIFVNNLIEKIDSLTTHNFVSKKNRRNMWKNWRVICLKMSVSYK